MRAAGISVNRIWSLSSTLIISTTAGTQPVIEKVEVEHLMFMSQEYTEDKLNIYLSTKLGTWCTILYVKIFEM